MITLQCHQVSKTDKQLKTVYLDELVDANLVTTDTPQRVKTDDFMVISVKVPKCRNVCDLAFRVGRNMKTLTTTAWNPGLEVPKPGRSVVLKVVGVRHCA